VVRAIVASRAPVVAAIGHERDVTISELVADQRAATPSNAAQLTVPDRQTIRLELAATQSALTQAIDQRLQEVPFLFESFYRATERSLAHVHQAFELARGQLISQGQLRLGQLHSQHSALTQRRDSLGLRLRQKLSASSQALKHRDQLLGSLNP